MTILPMPTVFGGSGCRFVVGPREGGDQHQCGAPQTVASSYCAEHHALCHIAPGSKAERRLISRIEKIGFLLGGRRVPLGHAPSPSFIRRLEGLQR
jgi:hypothetical protein